MDRKLLLLVFFLSLHKKTKTKQDVKAGRLITLSTLCWKMKTIHKRQMKRRSHVPTTTTGNVGTCGGW